MAEGAMRREEWVMGSYDYDVQSTEEDTKLKYTAIVW
jgi:hypothetical protein